MPYPVRTRQSAPSNMRRLFLAELEKKRIWIEVALNRLYIREASFGLCGSQIELFSKAAKVFFCLLSLWTPLFQKYEAYGSTWPHECYVCSSTKFGQYPPRQPWNVCCTRIVFIKLVVLSCKETYSKHGMSLFANTLLALLPNFFRELALQSSKRTTIKACMSVRIFYFAGLIRLQRSNSLFFTVKSVECTWAASTASS